MMKTRLLSLLCLLLLGVISFGTSAQSRIFGSGVTPEQIKLRIENQPWADSIYTRLLQKIEPLADRHITDPQWIVSRLAMYWRDGEHYTQCYLKDQNWDYGEGNAPVPTVRMPGMRTWNKYKNVPLDERIPYNESGDMLGLEITNPDAPATLVPYKESGHMVRANNVEILTIAEESAMLYWLTGEEKYALLAADIFNTWLIGTYYMNPILDPEESTGGKGGWEPGGICGYYDYEQIHDDLGMYAAETYDFQRDYLLKNQDTRITATGKSVDQMTSEVLKRFIDLGMIRGGKSGNWNVNGWNMMLLPILALDDNSEYADGHGKQYYLDFLINTSTPWHDAIPDIVKTYDPVTGLCPESPGYSFGTIAMLLDFASLLKKQDIDIIAQYPILEKAAKAVFPWMDSRGNMIVFGDSRGGAANFSTFENLLSYYQGIGKASAAYQVASAINTGIVVGSYDRSEGDWKSLFLLTDSVPQTRTLDSEAASYSPFHRLITLKNKDLMSVIYGGRKGSHLTANGLALQLYGFGYALAPDAAAYESYWSDDHRYHQSPTGSNTIMPGYTGGDITINASWPEIDQRDYIFYPDHVIDVRMADVTAGEKRRVVLQVPKPRASGGGYYVDIFRSDLDDNHYLYHNVGKSMDFIGQDLQCLQTIPVQKLDTVYAEGYRWFKNPRLCDGDNGDINKVVWNITDSIQMVMHPTSSSGRAFYAVDAPYSSLNPRLTPEGVSTPPSITPTLIISQRNQNAKERPFVAVFEPSIVGEEYISSVTELPSETGMVKLRIYFVDGTYDLITSGGERHLEYEARR